MVVPWSSLDYEARSIDYVFHQSRAFRSLSILEFVGVPLTPALLLDMGFFVFIVYNKITTADRTGPKMVHLVADRTDRTGLSHGAA